MSGDLKDPMDVSFEFHVPIRIENARSFGPTVAQIFRVSKLAPFKGLVL
jgi:hypothetical protein